VIFIIPLGFLFLPSNILIGKTGGASIVFIFSFFYFALDCSNTGLFHLLLFWTKCGVDGILTRDHHGLEGFYFLYFIVRIHGRVFE
jgi:hypothetical protein